MQSSIYPDETEADIIEFLIDSARAGDVADAADIEQILDDNINFVNVQNDFGQSMLHYACANGNILIVDLLLKDKYRNKVDMNIRNKEGNTPLHWAAMNNQKEIIVKLLDAGCDTSVKNSSGHTALQEIQDLGFEDSELLLIDKDKDLDEFIRTCEDAARDDVDVKSSSDSDDSGDDTSS